MSWLTFLKNCCRVGKHWPLKKIRSKSLVAIKYRIQRIKFHRRTACVWLTHNYRTRHRPKPFISFKRTSATAVSFRGNYFYWCEVDAITRMVTEHMTSSYNHTEIVSFIHLCIWRETWIDYRPSSTGKTFRCNYPKRIVCLIAGWNWVSSFYCLTLPFTSTRIV